jgi:hypothetical protein
MNSLIRTVASMIQEVRLNSAQKREITRLTQIALANITDAGQYIPFLTDLGQPAAITLGPYGNIVIDDVTILYISSISGTKYATSVDVVLKCDTSYLLSQPLGWTTYRDILLSLGPIGCVEETEGSCQCWLEVTHKSCVAVTNMQTNPLWLGPNTTSLNSSLWCAGSLTTIPTVTIEDGQTPLDYFENLCTNEPLVAGTNYKVVSNVLSRYYNIAYDTTYCVNNDLITLFEGTTLDLISITFQIFQGSYVISTVLLGSYAAYVDGVIPADLSTEDQPFARIQGQDAECINAAFMSYSSTYVPVYKLTNPRIQATVTTAVNNVSFIDTQLTITIPEGFLLPAGQLIVGNVLGSTVYDVDANDISVGPTASSREGTVAYAGCLYNNSANCTLAAWKTRFEEDFNAFEGDNVVSFYARAVNRTTGLCIGPNLAAEGNLCDIMTNYYVSLNTQLEEMVFEPRTASYTAQLTLPNGVLIQSQTSICPIANVIPTSGAATTLSLYNPTASAITCAVVITGACPATYSQVAVATGGSRSILINSCEEGAINATVFKYVGIDLVACSNASNLDVSTNRSYVIDNIQLPDTFYVKQQSSTIADPVAVGVSAVQSQTLGLLLQLITANLMVFNNTNIPVLQSSLDIYSNITSQINSIVNTTNGILIDDRNFSYSSVYDLESPYLATLAFWNQQLFNSTNTTNTLIGQLATNAAQGATLYAALNYTAVILINATANLNNATQEFLSATGVFIQNVQKTFLDLSSTGLGGQFLSSVVDLVKQGASDVVNGIESVAADVFNAITTIVTTVVKAASGLFDMLSSTVGNFVMITLFVLLGLVGLGMIYGAVKVYQGYQKGQKALRKKNAPDEERRLKSRHGETEEAEEEETRGGRYNEYFHYPHTHTRHRR